MRILITGVGGPTPRAVARSLKDSSRSSKYQLIGTDSNPLSIGLYQLDTFERTLVVPPAEDVNYWNVIDRLLKDEKVQFAIVQPEREVLAWSRRKREYGLPCEALIPDEEVALTLTNKGRMGKLLHSEGLVPPSFTFKVQDRNTAHIENKLDYPFWIRSTTGSSGLASLKITDRHTLQAWISINPTVKEFVATRFLPGRNLACKLLYHNGQLLRSACAERVYYVMANISPSGITGNTSFGRLINEPHIAEVASRAMDVIFERTKSEKNGCFTVDIKEDFDNTPMVTEINIRHVAFTSAFAQAGANFSEDTLRLLARDPEFDLTYRQYLFEEGAIFLRDVDALPVLMNESDLLQLLG